MPGVEFPASLLALMQELGELKRIRSAGRDGSIAQRLFADAWSFLLAGRPAQDAMRASLGQALGAVRLGDIDAPALRGLGLAEPDVMAVLQRSVRDVTEALDPWLEALAEPGGSVPVAILPEFVSRLAEQPRAGVTCPGRPRLVLEPPENHAEHCLMVAVYGVLLCRSFGADPATVWLAGLSHHLHNAFLADSGFAGEMLLGEHLAALMERASGRALAQLPVSLAHLVAEARTVLPDASTPEGRAFHAADTLDRVWQIGQHLRAGQTSLHEILHDMALVHHGPVKPFQDAVLRAAGLPA